jgi:formate C-acetyltransferase
MNFIVLNQHTMFEKIIVHTETPERVAASEGNFYQPDKNQVGPGMNERIQNLRKLSVGIEPSLSIERALHETAFYKEHFGKMSVPVLRAANFLDHCRRKTIYIGDGELIIGERGPKPKSVPTFPELTCHSVEDLNVLNTRELQRYTISQEDIDTYAREVIPYWSGRTQRERIFSHVPQEWRKAYEAGMFTEFMEQRAPGHTTLDGKIYRKGMLDFKLEIAGRLASLDYLNDPEATDKAEEWKAMDISCDAAILFAERHAALAETMATKETNPGRKSELLEIARVCRRVPANAPRNLWEAIQMYWFVHLGTITELNGWDAMNPGHFDQHLTPFYDQGLTDGTLTREQAKELISCFWIKVNNHPAPPKVGITALESGTYNDFTNINIGGIKSDGSDGTSEVSYIMLEVIQELHILQPGSSVHISTKTPDKFLNAATHVIRQGHGYPSVFNTDVYIVELLRQGKSLQDAREGGCSGCIEVGAFGKEAYLLTGYLNVPKIIEVTLNNGINPLTGIRVGPATGDPRTFKTYDELYEAFLKQIHYVVDLKMRVSNYIDRMFAKYAPAPFLSVVIDDCVSRGKDYYDGGPRYNTSYIQCCGLGTATDSLAALKKHVFDDHTFSMDRVLKAVSNNFKGEEVLRQTIMNRTPFFGNDDDYADSIAVKIYDDLVEEIDEKPNIKPGGKYHLNMLSTTCHVYFGKVMGATPNGRMAGKSISDGTSPSHGADTHGPSAVIKSLTKFDHSKSGGTLLNQRFLPGLLKKEEDVIKLGHLIRSYFTLGGHHIQLNIVDTATLLAAQACPADYKDLIVRMAGYSDYFNDMNSDLQQEVIERTENDGF